MHNFGEQLRQKRERRRRTIEEIARETKIRLTYLQALEGNEFEELPGSAFGKLYIRAYAEILGFDPEPLIAEYDRERYLQVRAARTSEAMRSHPAPCRPKRRRRAWLDEPANGTAVEPPLAEPTPVEPTLAQPALVEPTPAQPAPAEAESAPVAVRPRRRTTPPGVAIGTLAWVAFGVLMLVALVHLLFFRTGVNETPPAVVQGSALRPFETAARPTAPPAAAPEPASGTPSSAAKAETSTLSVASFGVGRRIVDRRLQGGGESFREGEVAVFQTRVLGGTMGAMVRHVWLREGRWVETIPLELGGTHWRTHSRKTLWGVGTWTVEARDASGRVLASDTFVVVPR